MVKFSGLCLCISSSLLSTLCSLGEVTRFSRLPDPLLLLEDSVYTGQIPLLQAFTECPGRATIAAVFLRSSCTLMTTQSTLEECGSWDQRMGETRKMEQCATEIDDPRQAVLIHLYTLLWNSWVRFSNWLWTPRSSRTPW